MGNHNLGVDCTTHTRDTGDRSTSPTRRFSPLQKKRSSFLLSQWTKRSGAGSERPCSPPISSPAPCPALPSHHFPFAHWLQSKLRPTFLTAAPLPSFSLSSSNRTTSLPRSPVQRSTSAEVSSVDPSETTMTSKLNELRNVEIAKDKYKTAPRSRHFTLLHVTSRHFHRQLAKPKCSITMKVHVTRETVAETPLSANAIIDKPSARDRPEINFLACRETAPPLGR